MTEDKIKEVEIEMDRLRERIAKLRGADRAYAYCNPKESGAVRRSSMDLTRALANLRRSES